MGNRFYGVPLERSDYLELPPNFGHCREDELFCWLENLPEGTHLAVDLFSGAGGLSLGLQRAGWTIAAAVDSDATALETHAAYFSGLSLEMDLGRPESRDRLVELLAPATIDLVAGGPPCQPFSRAGRSKIRSLVERHGRDPHDRRKELWGAFLDVVRRVRPRAVLMENVPDMGLQDDFAAVRAIEQNLEDHGYATGIRFVGAWHHGTPQHRNRLVLLARSDMERFDWQPPLEEREWVTLRHAIGDLPSLSVTPRERVGRREMPYEQPGHLSEFATRMRENAPVDLVWDHMTRRVREDDHQIFQGMTSTSLYSDVKPELRRYRADHFVDKYKRLDWDTLSRSITAHIAKDGYWYIHPEQHRTLTVREAARVQTFPDWFRFAGNRSDAFRQIGNAVPPALGEAAAEALMPRDDQKEASHAGFDPRWKLVRQALTKWAENQRDSGPTRSSLPGKHLSGPQAAVVSTLASARTRPHQVQQVVDQLGSRVTLTQEEHDRIMAVAPSAAARRSLERLASVVDVESAWKSSPDGIPRQVGMKSVEASLFRLLTGEDLLWVGRAALRVAARVSGHDPQGPNQLTQGRLDLIRLVGSGDDAPLRMAATRLIGETVCTPREPKCQNCPLSEFCAIGSRPDDPYAGRDLFSRDVPP